VHLLSLLDDAFSFPGWHRLTGKLNLIVLILPGDI
jgi:hypothetical protein